MRDCQAAFTTRPMGWASRLLVGLLWIHTFVPMDVHGYELFQTLRHVETGFGSLDQAYITVLSPDDRHLYVGGVEAIMVMERDDTSGALTPVQTLKAARDGFGVPLIDHLVMSPDGLNLYVGSSFHSAIAVFARDPADGRLTVVQSLFHGDPQAVGLLDLTGLEISPDGDHVYTVSASEVEVGVFARSPVDGSLTFAHVVDNLRQPELQFPTSLAVAPAGDQVVVGDSSSGLLIFERDADGGGLTLADVFPSGASAVVRPFDLIFSPDGDHLYVSGQDADLATILSGLRRRADGTLSRIQTLRGLFVTKGWIMGADGSHLYSTVNSFVMVMSRAPTGQLDLVQQIFDGDGGVEGLRGSGVGAIDGQGRHLYVPAVTDSSLAIFERQGDGLLAFQDAIFDDEGITVDGLRDVEVLHATRDGRDIYALGPGDRVLTQFRRDADGFLQRQHILSLAELGFDQVVTAQRLIATPSDSHLMVIDNSGNAWVFRRHDNGRLQFLHYQILSFFPRSFAFDPQGRVLFVGTSTELTVWELDPDSGTLTRLLVSISGEPTFEWMAVDPTGRFVYGALSGFFSADETVLHTYRWDPAELRLTEVAAFSDPSLGDLMSGFMLTPDGRHLITSGSDTPESGVTVLTVDPDSGSLAFLQTLGSGTGHAGFNRPILGAMDASGTRLVALGDPYTSVVTSTFLARNPSTGRLEILEQRSAGDPGGPSTIADYRVLTWSPEGRQFYVFSTVSDSLYAFEETPQGPDSCIPSPQVLCLGEDGRFRVEAQWTDFVGQQGIGTKVVESGDSGLFWFFDDANWEMLVKVVDGCGFNGHHWVFAAATTNVEYTLTVTDTLRGVEAVYQNPLGVSSPAVTDTEALDSCP